MTCQGYNRFRSPRGVLRRILTPVAVSARAICRAAASGLIGPARRRESNRPSCWSQPLEEDGCHILRFSIAKTSRKDSTAERALSDKPQTSTLTSSANKNYPAFYVCCPPICRFVNVQSGTGCHCEAHRAAAIFNLVFPKMYLTPLIPPMSSESFQIY